MTEFSEYLSPIKDVIADIKAGKMCILVDDEDRENEGDLVIPAENVDADAINFMAKFGRGLICLALDKERVEHLGLPPMAQSNNSRHSTAFTVSIEAAEGISTGISAADRALTVQTAISDDVKKEDIVSPGHIFPLEAKEGGVLVRAGHTEAAVDIAHLAGMKPAGVICEIMNDDGTMARMPDLIPFAKEHGLKIATIADLIAYRRKHEKLVECKAEKPFKSEYGGDFTLKLYVNNMEYAEHIVLVKGEIDSSKPTWVRMHAANPITDSLGDADNPKTGELQKAMQMIEDNGNGVVVLLRAPQANSVSRSINKETGEKPEHLRNYGIGAQILLDLGIKDMILLTNSTTPVIGLEGYGLDIVERKAIK